jgi:mono/diheme cytochrome c family protein
MSMKRCFELPAGPSFSAVRRAAIVAGVLSLVMACARKDASKSESTAAASDSTTKTASAMTTPSSTPVESISTGETSASADSQANSGTANTSAKPAATTKTATASTHHVVHRADSSTTKHVAAPSSTSNSSSSTGSTTTAAPSPTSSTSTSTASAAPADTGEKSTADTSKKTASASGSADHLLVSPQEYEGWKMFSVYCYRCHGVDAMGGGIAPNLRHSVSSEGSVTHEVFIQTVTNGRLDKGMPTWKALLSPEQMEDLWLYINARSSGRLAPGRPHMASGANP